MVKVIHYSALEFIENQDERSYSVWLSAGAFVLEGWRDYYECFCSSVFT